MWEYPQPGPTWPVAKRSTNGGCLSAVLAFVVLIFALIVIGALQVDSSSHHSSESTTTRSYADRSPYPATSDRPLGPTEYTYPTRYTTTRPPPPVAVGECIAVSASGDVLGTVGCYGGRGAYRVLAVRYLGDRYDECPHPSSLFIPENGYRICVEVFLSRDYCYSVPGRYQWTIDRWITAVSCVPGAVVNRGVMTGAGCGGFAHWEFQYPPITYCVEEIYTR